MRDASASPRRRRRRSAAGFLAGALLLLVAPPCAAQSFDPSTFDRLLRAHVSADGLADYDAFARSAELRAYLGALAGADLATLPQAERLALWINAYNAYTIALINKHGDDFGASDRELLRYVGGFYPAGPERERLERGDLRIEYTAYDWSLNRR